MGIMSTGLAWLAAQRKAHNSRDVIYRRPSTGQSQALTVSVGQTQAVNVNSLTMEPSAQDMAVLAADATNRDYIVEAADLADFWPPQSGDLIDDDNDTDGVINRFQAMSLPGQNPWRWFRGGYQTHARIHTKFLSVYAALWLDEFTGTNGTALSAHAPDLPDDGSYGGGTGSIVIASNRIVAGDATAFRYFDPGEANATARADININTAAMALADKYAELGLGVRCASSGAGQRDGYYCSLKIGYASGSQSTKRLRIVKVASGVSTEVAVVDLPSAIDLATTYRLEVAYDAERITFSLLDSTGEVSIASVNHEPDAFTSQTASAVIFTHHASLADVGLPWLDHLEVEA